MAGQDKDQMYYEPPPERSISEQITTFLWNSETKQFLGRTASSWAKILLFYFIFYFVLSIFWGSLWLIFLNIAVNPHRPRIMLKESLIGSNPGLGFRPMPSTDYVDSALIWFKQSDRSYLNWTNQITEFLAPYRRQRSGDLNEQWNVVDCSYDRPAPPGKSCRFSIDKLHPCDKGYYKYDTGAPCIFLKLNKIYNWVPEFYNNTSELPAKMPTDLKDNIAQKARNNLKELNTVWVSCEGENAADKEHIGKIRMYPDFGFPGYYFPFANTEGYQSPLVAVWFSKPTRGILINIECKAWAKNIIYDRHDRRGSVHFELMIDN